MNLTTNTSTIVELYIYIMLLFLISFFLGHQNLQGEISQKLRSFTIPYHKFSVEVFFQKNLLGKHFFQYIFVSDH